MIERFLGRELDEQEQELPRQVEKFGWSITNIREQDGAPGWAFTIGLFENFGHPEVTIFGMDAKSRQSILNWIGKNVRDGQLFTSEVEHDWVLDGFKCWSRDVQKTWYRDLLGWAMWFYGGSSSPPSNASGQRETAPTRGRRGPHFSSRSRCCTRRSYSQLE